MTDSDTANHEREKLHLVLVHSFPTNSVLLHGLNEFLADFFTVHFIDLPGFHKNSPSLNGEITIQKFSDQVDYRVTELNIDEYIIGGVSFGFLVANSAKLDERCKAILAIEPFINTDSLNTSLFGRIFNIMLSTLFKLVLLSNNEKRVWESDWFSRLLQKGSNYPRERIASIVEHLDPRTFFSVANLLLHYDKDPIFHNLPYFLIGNFEDKTIDFSSVVEIFQKSLPEFKIFSVPIEHYPQDLTKKYFEERIPKENIHQIIKSIAGNTY